ncbi:MAG: hypothetical protein ACRERD_11275 [Candidatus Binatia bacterium]
MRTYKAILHGDRVEWLEQPPEKSRPVQVHITVLEEPRAEPTRERGRTMAEVLAALAQRGTFAEISDPVAWQRELRAERVLPDRES